MSFSGDIAKFTKKTADKTEKVFRATALDIFGKIVKATPVDEGRARGNWQMTLNTPSDKVLDTTTVQSTGAINRATNEDEIFITNNLPYIVALENGHSKQAPAGMVKTTLNEFEAIVNDNVLP